MASDIWKVMDLEQTQYFTVLLDGKCNLCNGSVKFIIRHDPHRRFRFASLQSDRGREIIEQQGRDANDIDTIQHLHTCIAATKGYLP